MPFIVSTALRNEIMRKVFTLRCSFAIALALAILAPKLAMSAGIDSPAPGAGDPIYQPATASALAPRSVLIGVTRAGPRIVAVGERGQILTSDNQGRSWQQAQVPVRVTLTAVHFANASTGWAVGHSGVILQSQDGGLSWRKQLDGVQANRLVFEAAQASGSAAQIARAQRLVQDGPDKPLFALYFSDAMHGMVVGAYGLAFETTDGGQHWQPVLDQIPNPDERHLYAIHKTPEGLYLAGEQGVLLRRQPQQQRFDVVATAFQSTVFDLLTAPDGALLAFGLGGKLYRTADQGRHWERVEPAGRTSLTAGVVVAEGVLVANEAGQLLLSTDSGRSFRNVSAGQAFPASGLVAAETGQLIVVGPLGVQAVATTLKKID